MMSKVGFGIIVTIHFIQAIFTRMAEGSMSYIMAQRYCLGKVFIEPKSLNYSASDLRNFQGVRQPGPDVILAGSNKHLGLLSETAESTTEMNNPIPVALEYSSHGTGLFRPPPPCRLCTKRCIRTKVVSLVFFYLLPDTHNLLL